MAIGPLIQVIIVIVLNGFIFALVIIGLIRLVRYLGTASQERQRLRLEVGKMAEEVHRLREDLGKKESSGEEGGQG